MEMIQGQLIVLKKSGNFFGTVAEKLHLHVETPNQHTVGHCSKRVTYSLAWLDDVDAATLSASKGTTVIDVEQMDEIVTREVDAEGCLSITACGIVGGSES